MEFDHDMETAYPLRGMHEAVPCTSCHQNLAFADTPKQCAVCHADFHQRKMGGDCERCHTVSGWKTNVSQVQSHFNRFPLLGAHALTNCESCHPGGATAVFQGLSTDCVSCHASEFAGTRNPNHQAAGFSVQCAECHGFDRFAGARFDHAAATGFLLSGQHATLECASCHLNQQFAGTSANCSTCHSDDYRRAKNPDHVAAAFPQDCAMCHQSNSWAGARFDHNALTRFALTGAHTQATCQQCHGSGTFAGTASSCDSCHMAAFEATKNPDHRRGNFSRSCENCHTTSQWQGAEFDHNLSRFALTGAHTSVNCQQCHVNNQFTGTSTECVDCHRADFDGTTNPPHAAAGFATSCTTCHTTAQWMGASFDHNTSTQFALTGSHTQVACQQCHVDNKFAGTATTCVGCHLGDYQAAAQPNHASAGFPQNCEGCHTTSQWRGASFDHNTATRFALTGAHTTVACQQCHVNNQFSGTAQNCAGCHLKDFQATTKPNHASAGFSQNCETCHTTAQWVGAQFDHSRTQFPLTGSHTQAECQQCHVNNQYAGTAKNCVSCHLGEFQKTTNPNHVAAGFPETCELCHNTAKWDGAAFNHNTTTQFPLTGAHTTVACQQCHVNNQFSGTAQNCAGCHLKDFQATTKPNHASAGFSQNCETCHTTAQWVGAQFDHSRTQFPLTGSHTQAECQQCHVNNQYAGTAKNCVSCHLGEFQKTTNPNHVAAGFPQTCELCHNTAKWDGAAFNHNTTTQFPLTGAHTTVACQQCHVNNQFSGTAQNCASCHLKDFQGTSNPNHAAAGFSQTCTLCHTTAQWKGATFNHNTATLFPLTGAHTTVSCQQCHVGSVFKGTAKDCASCHLSDFQKTTDPNHAAAGFPQTCEMCHNTAKWEGAVFNHSTSTQFPLTGAHTGAACQQCHLNGVFKGTAKDCASCHLPQYQQTTNPNHAAAGFPQDCALCHSTANWSGAAFNHSQTKFPLTGKHTNVTCAQCHKNNQYSGLGTACVNCHLNEYNGTQNPNHAAAAFPQDCQLCHSTTQWQGAVFNHATTRFPLTGAHATKATCAQCHVGGKYAGTPMDCYSCHRTEYETVTNPNHLAAGFPRTCESCHGNTTWSGATFNHRFPIYSGAHREKWTTCNECHTNSANYTVFTCTNCHEHSKTKMDDKHKGENGYVYNSLNCYACHPNGRAD
jgi:hypothetical protein